MTSLESDNKLNAQPDDKLTYWTWQVSFDQDALAVGVPANLQVEIPLDDLKELKAVEHLRIEVDSDCLGLYGKNELLKIADLKSPQQTITVVPIASGRHDFRVQFVLNNEVIVGLKISLEVMELALPERLPPSTN